MIIKSKSHLVRIEEAKNDYTALIIRTSTSIFAYRARNNLGKIYINEGFYDKGIELFQEVVENRIDETAAEAQFYIADAYKNQNRMEEARESYLKVRYIYPAFDSWVSRATIEAGDIYLKEENFAEARRMFESVLRKHENDEFGRIAREKIKLTENR